MEALSVDFAYKLSADKDVRSCWVKNVMLKICRSVPMPVLTPHLGIGSNWNTTTRWQEEGEKASPQPVLCILLCSIQLQSSDEAVASRTEVAGSLCHCPVSSQLLRWPSPELRGILLCGVILGNQWRREGTQFGQFISLCWVFSPLALYWDVLSLWDSADKYPNLSRARFGLATGNAVMVDSRRHSGWPAPGNHASGSHLTLVCELLEGGTAT